jgi:hypothetical protein
VSVVGTKISQYTDTGSIVSTDRFVIAREGTNYSVGPLVLADYTHGTINSDIGTISPLTGDQSFLVHRNGTDYYVSTTAVTSYFNANTLAYTALATAWTGTAAAASSGSVATSALNTAWAGTTLAYTALTTAWAGTAAAVSAGSVASAALTTAWSGTTTANAIALTDAGGTSDGSGLATTRSGNNLPVKRIAAGNQILVVSTGSNVTIHSTAGTFSPSNTVAAPVLWLKADTLSLSNGAPVSTWNSSATIVSAGTQATAANQPTYVTNVFGNMPSVRFDGVASPNNDFMGLSVPVTLTASTGFTVVVIGSFNTDSVLLGNSAANNQFRAGTSGQNQLTLFDSSATATSGGFANALTSLRMMVWRRVASASISFFEGGRARGTGSTSLAVTIDRIGVTNSVFNPASGDFGEIIVWLTDLADAELYDLYKNYVKLRYPTIT